MTEETETQTSQEVESDSQGDTPSFTESDYVDSIAESKKYRQRAQRAESKFDKLQKQVESSRQKQMEEQEEWRALAEERAAKISELEPIVEQAKSIELSIREGLLSDFSDEDRENFKDLPTPALRKVHGKIVQQKPAKTDMSSAGISLKPSKKMSDMTDAEKRDNWSNILSGYIK